MRSVTWLGTAARLAALSHWGWSPSLWPGLGASFWKCKMGGDPSFQCALSSLCMFWQRSGVSERGERRLGLRLICSLSPALSSIVTCFTHVGDTSGCHVLGQRPFLQLGVPAKAENQTRVTPTWPVALGAQRDPQFTSGLTGTAVSACPALLGGRDVNLC